MLQRDCGATLEELIAATDWLPHTTRAALTGLRKRGYAVTIDRSDKERGSTYRARSDETIDVEQAGSQSDDPPTISATPKIEESSALGEAASATGRVMSPGRHSGDVGENHSLPASSQSKAETLDVTVAGLADLDADQLRLQWRNHLGGTAPAHLPRWLLLRVLAYRLQAAALGDLDKATVRSIRASQGDAIDFAGSPFKKRKPRTRDGIGLNPGALLVREWKGKLERVMVLDNGFAWKGRIFTSLSQTAKIRQKPDPSSDLKDVMARASRRTRFAPTSWWS